MNAVREDVESLVQKELDSANKKFPLFSSPHEGYAVMLEELEEAECELSAVHNDVYNMWVAVKVNDVSSIAFAEGVKENAIKLACEAIQVAAMAQKFMDSWEHKS